MCAGLAGGGSSSFWSPGYVPSEGKSLVFLLEALRAVLCLVQSRVRCIVGVQSIIANCTVVPELGHWMRAFP